jgi:hypothetical protein
MTISLTAGDTYLFRLRADHNDGSVSDYVQSEPVTIPISDAPTLDVSTVEVGPEGDQVPELEVSWSGVLSSSDVRLQVQSDALPGGTQWYTIVTGDLQDWPADYEGTGTYGSAGEYANGAEGYMLDPEVYGTGLYTYRICSTDAYGNVTRWSDPESGYFTSTGPQAAPAGLTLSSTDTTITASWPASDGDGAYALLMQQDGVDGEVGGAGLPSAPIDAHLNADGTEYVGTINNLTPGTTYDFNLYNGVPGAWDVPCTTFTKESISTTGTAPMTQPAGPGDLSAIWGASGQDGMFLHWADYANNETSFDVLRSIDGGPFASVGETGEDDTTFNDQLPANFLPGEALSYEVEAVNGSATSAPATTQPSTQPTIIAKVFGQKLFQVFYKGAGKPSFFQTVSISGNPITKTVRDNETKDHGGKDPFNGPVADNPQGNPDTPMPEHKIPGGWTMQDGPQFPDYPIGFVGTKTFVTTVKDAAGNILKTIHWHTRIDAKGNITTVIDSQ